MRLTTNWNSLRYATGSLREQARRESNGTAHVETRRINAEIAGDSDKTRVKRSRPMDIERINQSIASQRKDTAYNNLRMKFGPRLVLPDGTARYAL